MTPFRVLFLVPCVLPALLSAQVSYLGAPYVQDFNTLAGTTNNTANVTWTDNNTLPGWYASKSAYHVTDGTMGGSASAFDSTSSPDNIGLISFGSAGSTDRALGSRATSTLSLTTTNAPVRYGVRFVNGTAATITTFSILLTGEQWFASTQSAAHTLQFDYQLGATSLSSGTWVSNFTTFTAPVATGNTARALDGNTPSNRRALAGHVNGISWLPGQELWVRVTDTNEAESEQGLAIDDFTFIAGNTAPTISLTAPTAGAADIGTGGTVSLAAGVSDPDGQALSVTFYGRVTSPPPGADFTLVTIPDTQFYSQNTGGNRLSQFISQTQWIVSAKDTHNIAFVAHMGDMVQDGDAIEQQWINADGAMDIIENPVTTLLTHGIPWGGAPGNHDQQPIGSPDGASAFWNQYFGTSRWAGRPYFGGNYSTNNDNNYQLFSASGMDFIIINLEYRPSANQAVLDWADALLKAHPTRRAIITSHWLIGIGNPAAWGGHGQAVYDNLKDNPNLFLMLCGHIHGEGRRSDTFEGRTVHTVLQDYQDRSGGSGGFGGGDGWLRYFVFSPANNEIYAKTYRTTSGTFETDGDSQFTLPYAMDGGSVAWVPLGTVNVAPGGTTADLDWTGLSSNTGYEWYAAVSDGITPVASTVRTFTTAVNPFNVPPSVELTAPADGTTIIGSAISMTADAGDTDGTVIKVEFYNGAGKIGEDLTAPYVFSQTNVSPGSYALTTKAIDNDGGSTVSSVVNVTVVPAGAFNGTYAANFNEMGTSGASPPQAWSVWNLAGSNSAWTTAITGSGVATMTANDSGLTASNTPSANANNGYNAGTPGDSANRMLGSAPTSLVGMAFQLELTNTAGAPINALEIAYDIRRFTAPATGNELPGYWLFQSLDNGTTWTNVSALNPTLSGPGGVIVPNTTGVTTVPPTGFALAGTWAHGTKLLLRWVDDNAVATSPDQIHGLDNVLIELPTLFEQWKMMNTGNLHTQDDSDSGDYDGLGLLLEYSFGLNPTLNDNAAVSVDLSNGVINARGMPAVFPKALTEGEDFRAVYIRRKVSTNAGMSSTPQFSSDLSDWQNGTDVPVVVASDLEFEAVALGFPTLANGRKARFFRIVAIGDP